MNTSFYGGREGRSFVIVKEFKTIAEMVEKFRQGPSYKEVNFDEYVLINTEHKNNPENGRIFRRGYDFSSGRTISCFRLKQFYDGNGELLQNYYENTINAAGAVYIGWTCWTCASFKYRVLSRYCSKKCCYFYPIF